MECTQMGFLLSGAAGCVTGAAEESCSPKSNIRFQRDLNSAHGYNWLFAPTTEH